MQEFLYFREACAQEEEIAFYSCIWLGSSKFKLGMLIQRYSNSQTIIRNGLMC